MQTKFEIFGKVSKYLSEESEESEGSEELFVRLLDWGPT